MARPGVLIIDPPGNHALRWRVEAEVDRRGWHLAVSAADAGLMLIIGEPSAELRNAADVLWSQMPHPRHRRVIDATDLGHQLDAALSQLITSPAYEENRIDPATLLAHNALTEHAAEEGDSSGADMGGHMHHGGDIAGLAMAGTAPDRDGLELDELRVTLGPVLPGWPTGLVLAAGMQGDVLTDVKMSWTDAVDEHAVDQRHADPVLVALDALARFSLVAGWPRVALQARNARSELLAASDNPTAMDQGRRSAAAVARKVRRSRLLAWSLRGMGAVGASSQTADRQDEDARLLSHRTRDVLDRVHTFAAVAAREETSLEAVRIGPENFGLLVEGAELAAVRLIVASFVPVPWATTSMSSVEPGASGDHGHG